MPIAAALAAPVWPDPDLWFAGIGVSFVVSWAAEVIYVAALLWLIPERRIERQLTSGTY